MKPRRTQKIRWLPPLAYAIGLIASDGNLSKDKRHIEFTSKDKELVKIFKRNLNLRNKIGYKMRSSSSNQRYPRIQFGDVIFYKWLIKIGLTPNKSGTLSALKIPNKYFFDFLRGYFDGDGSFYSYWDRRWKSSFMFYTTFASGNLIFIKWLRERIKKLLNIKGYINPNGTRQTWELKFAKKESKILLSKLYYSNKIPFLKRKYNKIKKAQVEEMEDSHL